MKLVLLLSALHLLWSPGGWRTRPSSQVWGPQYHKNVSAGQRKGPLFNVLCHDGLLSVCLSGVEQRWPHLVGLSLAHDKTLTVNLRSQFVLQSHLRSFQLYLVCLDIFSFFFKPTVWFALILLLFCWLFLCGCCSSVSIWSELNLECHHSAVEVEAPGSGGSSPAFGKTPVFPKASLASHTVSQLQADACTRFPPCSGTCCVIYPRGMWDFPKA